MAISMAKAKALCTAEELAIVAASVKTQVGKLSAAELKSKVSQARKLRDKWRDQATKQTRAAQTRARGRGADGSARSGEKAELFGEVLGRFEAELAKPKSQRSEAKRPRKAAPLATKKPDHRADRAEARGMLKEKKLMMRSEARNQRAAGEPRQPAAHEAEGAPSSAAESKSIEQQPKKKRAPGKSGGQSGGKSKKASRAVTAEAATSGPGATGLTVSKRQQLQARTAAKETRLKKSGIVRIQKHTSAQNRRQQGKRDSR